MSFLPKAIEELRGTSSGGSSPGWIFQGAVSPGGNLTEGRLPGGFSENHKLDTLCIKQKQSPVDVLQKICFDKFRKFHSKTYVLEFLF